MMATHAKSRSQLTKTGQSDLAAEPEPLKVPIPSARVECLPVD
jgi:hypothetical protein